MWVKGHRTLCIRLTRLKRREEMRSHRDSTTLVLSQEEDGKCVFVGTWVQWGGEHAWWFSLCFSVAFPQKATIALADRLKTGSASQGPSRKLPDVPGVCGGL